MRRPVHSARMYSKTLTAVRITTAKLFQQLRGPLEVLACVAPVHGDTAQGVPFVLHRNMRALISKVGAP